ncbi:MAG: tetratricopeptide repeat protein [Spirochaetes bacterium]|nr:tetratricopeptide repeat protein [Spirochaetota bacterium]
MRFTMGRKRESERPADDGFDLKTNRISSIEAEEARPRRTLKPAAVLLIIAGVLVAGLLVVTTFVLKRPDFISPSSRIQLLPFDAFEREKGIRSDNIHIKRGIESYEKGYTSDAITEFTAAVESDAPDRDKAIALLYLGIIEDNKGKYKEAIDLYQRALRYDKDNPEIYRNLSQAYRHNKDYDGAMESAEKSLALQDKDANSRILLGNIYYEQGKYREAVAQYDEALRVAPEKPAVLYNKASALLKMGDEFAAMEYFQKAGTFDRIGEVAHKAYSRLGVLYTQRNIYDSAEEYLKKAVAIRPQNSLNHYNLGIVYLRQKRNKEAMDEFRLAEQMGEENAAMLENLGEAYLSLKDYDRSLEMYNRVSRIDSRNVRILSKIGELYYEKGELDRAMQMFSRITEIDPLTENARVAYMNMGNILDDAQRYDEAIMMYEKALTISPKDDATYYNLGLAYVHAGKPEKAVDAWRRGGRLNERDPKFLLAVANLYYEKRFYDLAEQEYQTVVNRWPNEQEGHFKLATIYYKRGNYASALKAYNRVTDINETGEMARVAYINSALLYSRVHKDEGSLDKSVNILQKALLMKPGDPEALFSLGLLYERKAMCDKAIDTYYLVIRAATDSKVLGDTYNHLGRCYYKQKNYRKALQAFSRGVEEDPMNEEIRLNRKVAQQAYEAAIARER